MMEIERAHCSILITMLKKPFKYPTEKLCEDSKVFNVCQLYKTKNTVKMYRTVLNYVEYTCLLKRRVYKIGVPKINSSYARRFSPYIDRCLYYRLASACEIRKCTIEEAKLKSPNGCFHYRRIKQRTYQLGLYEQ